MESLHDWIKSQIANCYEIADIQNIDNKEYRIFYIQAEHYQDYPPSFTIQSCRMNLQVQMRDIKIEEILNSPISDFDVEDIIYSEEEREKLKQLRGDVPNWDKLYLTINKVKKEYSDSFQIGDKIKYNGGVGFITFKHAEKNETDFTRWSVKINDTEFRYVLGTELIKRKIEDLSHIPIDPELNKFTTEQLLRMFRSKRNRDAKGKGDINIKRILQEREHIQKGPNKIKIIK